ncbi:MAG TPA: hypothetical protein VG820_05345 [Fimbriimonadaceae bacterium]|nr:hypothetical protein [Fimbriimonadaceae bacterium]
MAVSRPLGLGVLETRWFNERHHTVRPLFEFLSYALKDRPDAFTYERFVGASSFREAVRFMIGQGDIDYLYVAAHGDFGKIEASDGSGLSRTFLRNTINEVNQRRRRLKGVLFGSCKFGDAYNLIELLRPSKIRGKIVANRLLWAGGYDQEIEYTRSSLFDIYFYDLFLRTSAPTEMARLEKTVADLKRTLPGFAENLSLCIVAKHSNGRYRDLIRGVDIYD